jgi:PTS system N-acetylglucosamine-specific IIC component
VFRFVIVRFDLATPGRERGETVPAAPRVAATAGSQAAQWVAALGGAANLLSVNACTTRLRLSVASQSAVDEAALKRLGARGLVRPSANALQVVVGPTADALASEIREVSVRDEAKAAPPAPVATTGIGLETEYSPVAVTALLAALGGRSNVRAVAPVAGRVRIAVNDPGCVQHPALAALELRGFAQPSPQVLHLLTGPEQAAALAAALARALA